MSVLTRGAGCVIDPVSKVPHQGDVHIIAPIIADPRVCLPAQTAKRTLHSGRRPSGQEAQWTRHALLCMLPSWKACRAHALLISTKSSVERQESVRQPEAAEGWRRPDPSLGKGFRV